MTCSPRVKEEAQDDFKDIDEQYYDCLTVATLISKMCISTAYQEDHRISRLLKLLRLVKNAADEFVNSFDFVPGQAPSVDNGHAETQNISIKKHLESSIADIEALGDTITRLWQGHNDAPILSEHSGSIAAYFDGGPYDLRKAAKCLRQDQGTMVIEANNIPVHQMRADSEPLWSHHEPEMEMSKQYMNHGALNSIWRLLIEKGILGRSDLGACRKLCQLLPTASLVFAEDEEVSCEDDDCEHHGHLHYDHSPSCRYTAWWAPHELAIAMIDMHVDVGFVFCDDHSVIVWPLGMVHAVQGRGIVLYCRPQHQPRASCYDLGPAGRYTSLRTTESERESEEHTNVQPSVVKRFKGILDLPPELRMHIYDAYFSLAMARIVENTLRASWDSSHVADQVLGYYGSYIGYQFSSRPLIHSLSISYKFHEDMIDIDLGEQARRNKKVAVYMEDGSPKSVQQAYMKGLCELVDNLAEDNVTCGLTLVDVMVINDFLRAH
ncbi:hypothetical protein LTR81_007369 [Elasticomyces elasticus]